MKTRAIILLSLIWFFAVQSCAAGKARDAEVNPYPEGEIPFPEIPATVTDPMERATYVLMHFWDDFDFTRHDFSLDTTFMEQNFANFVQFYPYVNDSVATQTIDRLLGKASEDPEAVLLLADLGSKYLGDQSSPYRNETAYIALLQGMLAKDLYPVSDALRAKYALKNALKNRPGDAAADFSFISRDGRDLTLYSSNKAPYTLLFLYNPDCDTCHEMIEEVKRNKDLMSLAERGTVAVVAVSAEGEREDWDKTKNQLPASWIVGFDTSGILDNETYVYDFPPAIYLLDRNKRVILKEPSLQQLLDYARSH